MNSNDFFCVGNSHLASVRHALNEASLPASCIHTTKILDAGEQNILPEVKKTATGKVFSLIGGNSHNVVGLVQHRQPFDFIHPEHQDLALDPRARLLPFSAVRDVIAYRGGRWVKAFNILCKEFPGQVVHIESPPPIDDEAYIAEGIKESMMEKGNPNFSIAPFSLRYKLWRLNSEIFKNLAEKNGAQFIPVPPAAYEHNGALRKEYWGNPTHANAAYGHLLIDQIRALA